MKLNFWQWLGVVLLIVGAIVYVTKKKDQPRTVPAPSGPSPTAPVTTQAS